MASEEHKKFFENVKGEFDSKTEAQREEDYNRRVNLQYENAQKRQSELVDSNATLPVTISSITVLNARNTRRSFLQRIFNPLLSDSKNNAEPYTLGEALRVLSEQADRLNRLEIYQTPISLFLDRPSQTDPSTTPTDVSVFYSVRELSRLVLTTGTWVGSNDGSVYGNLLLRNILGGAESLTGAASFGTRTRSSYSALFSTPILSNPDFRFELSALTSATAKPWASHDELLTGGSARLRYASPSLPGAHELAYNATWRQVTHLAANASPTVRTDAGDSFKSSLAHTWTLDRRDYPLLPTRGFFMKTVAELAGFGPLRGDIASAKVEFDTQAALPVPVPFLGGLDSGVSFTMGLRGGALCPLALGGPGADMGTGEKQQTSGSRRQGEVQRSRMSDRFVLGGPTDVRGFRLAGLGPHDGQDSVGGDVFAAGGASLLVPFPRVGKDKPLRFQAFVNGGRLVALQDGNQSGGDQLQRVQSTVAGMLHDGMPSVAAGVGVVYALPVARFELNFSLPLVVRRGEEARKGLSLGVGLNFL